MKRLDIRLAAGYSDIKAHTIRVWEQRYGLLKPEKRAGNRREYTSEDIITLMDIALLTKYGYSISKLSRLSKERIIEITDQLSSSAAAGDISINKLLSYYLRTDIFNFENTINEFASKKGLHLAITELIIPFIERTELFSYTNQNVSAHFAVNIAIKKIIAATEQLKQKETKEKTIILFLPPGEYFDLILLYLSYQLQYNGHRVVYLGADISFDNVAELSTKHKADALVTYIQPYKKNKIKELRESVIAFFNDAQLFMATSEKNSTHYSQMAEALFSQALYQPKAL